MASGRGAKKPPCLPTNGTFVQFNAARLVLIGQVSIPMARDMSKRECTSSRSQ